MVTLHVGGKPLSWADAEKVFAEAARTQAIEFLVDSGRVFATSVPGTEPIPAWEQAITPEETARRMAEPFYTFEEMKKKLGWE